MQELKHEFLCELEADLEEPIPVGETPQGARVIFNVKGGSVNGPKLKGEVLPMGADWAMIRSDGAVELDVRACMRTEDGEVIYVYYRGIIKAEPVT